MTQSNQLNQVVDEQTGLVSARNSFNASVEEFWAHQTEFWAHQTGGNNRAEQKEGFHFPSGLQTNGIPWKELGDTVLDTDICPALYCL